MSAPVRKGLAVDILLAGIGLAELPDLRLPADDPAGLFMDNHPDFSIRQSLRRQYRHRGLGIETDRHRPFPFPADDLILDFGASVLNAIHPYTSILFIRRLAVNDQKHFHAPHLLIHVRPIVRRRRERLPFLPLRRHFSSSGAV
jgi:hypothetical protein